ncbi:MAG: hypothetical protein KC620_16295 [Myxococcales bacterium]|nr:hypothetical protein [Myxococcales bacterium]
MVQKSSDRSTEAPERTAARLRIAEADNSTGSLVAHPSLDLISAGLIAQATCKEVVDPLSGALICAQTLLAQDGVGARGRNYVSAIIDAIERARAAVNNVTDMHAPDRVGHPRTVDLAELSGRCAQLVRAAAASRGAAIESRVGEETHPVHAAPGDAERALVHLLLAALSQASVGTVVAIEPVRSRGRVGLRVGQLDRQAKARAAESFDARMGLTIADHIAERNGGGVELRDTSVVLWLPKPPA